MTTIAEQLHAEGRLEGKVEGKVEGEALATARSILRILRARGLPVTASAERQIKACTALPTLERWLDRALVEASVEAVLRT